MSVYRGLFVTSMELNIGNFSTNKQRNKNNQISKQKYWQQIPCAAESGKEGGLPHLIQVYLT